MSGNGDLRVLLEQVKTKCRVTWDDEVTDSHIAGEIIPSALAVCRFKIGIPPDTTFDFTKPGLEHMIFVNYCYYAWHDAEDDFWDNFAADVAHARSVWEVKAYAEQQEASSELS